MVKLGRIITYIGYPLSKHLIFQLTKNNPELAHKKMIDMLQVLSNNGWDKLLFDEDTNQFNSIPLSNAAGFNKDGDIPTGTLRYLGFNRVVVGTVTNKPWKGNSDKQRILRFPQTQSLVNYLGLPGIGSAQVARNLEKYHNSDLPLTINVMSTPQREGGLEEEIEDILGTLQDLKDFGDRIELNISCPNTHSISGNQTRTQYQENLAQMLDAIVPKINKKELYLKKSPDMDESEVRGILEVCDNYEIAGFVATNTTTNHNPHFITKSPGKGGASGKAVFGQSLKIQRLLRDIINEDYKNKDYTLIGCGGIESLTTAQKRIQSGAKELQIYTGFVFKGPALLTELRENLRYY